MRPKGKLFDLEKFRKERNLTQKDLSIATKRPQSFLSAIEHGKRSAPKSFLDELKMIYHVEDFTIYLKERPKENNQPKTIETSLGNGNKFNQLHSPSAIMFINPGSDFNSQEFKDSMEQCIAYCQRGNKQGPVSKEDIKKAPTQDVAAPVQEHSVSSAESLTKLISMLHDAHIKIAELELKIRELEQENKALKK